MNYFDLFFLVCAIYRIKYPGYYCSEQFSVSSLPSAFDIFIKVIIVMQLSTNQEIPKILSIGLVYASVLPHYPWFILLNFIQMGLLKVPCAILCIYGLEQKPWNFSPLYQLEKYKIFFLTLAIILGTN